jgi:hypothetical protein
MLKSSYAFLITGAAEMSKNGTIACGTSEATFSICKQRGTPCSIQSLKLWLVTADEVSVSLKRNWGEEVVFEIFRNCKTFGGANRANQFENVRCLKIDPARVFLNH